MFLLARMFRNMPIILTEEFRDSCCYFTAVLLWLLHRETLQKAGKVRTFVQALESISALFEYIIGVEIIFTCTTLDAEMFLRFS